MAIGANPHQPLRSVELASEHGQHIHAGVRLALQENRDILAIHFEANCFLERHGVGLMRGLVQHGGEAEKFAEGRLVYHNFLIVFVDGGDPHTPGNHHVGTAAGFANFVNALSRSKCL